MKVTVSLVFAVFTLLYTVDGAGRSFPVESENYAVERFQRINTNIEWDETNFLVDASGVYADCRYVGQSGPIAGLRLTPTGSPISGVVETVEGRNADINSVNGYIKTVLDRWLDAHAYDQQIRDSRRFGCSVRPGCTGQAVIACLFSSGKPSMGGSFGGVTLLTAMPFPNGGFERSYSAEELKGRSDSVICQCPNQPTVPVATERPTPEPTPEPLPTPEELKEINLTVHALAFTKEQYKVAESFTGIKWDKSHELENLSGTETQCAMLKFPNGDWPFEAAESAAPVLEITITHDYGFARNLGSTDNALKDILSKFHKIKTARQIGCSIRPDCIFQREMYVVVACLYQN